MTAKEIVHQLQDDGIMTEDKAVMLIKSYALKIAQEAVEEVMKQNIKADLHDVGWNGACNTILSRIEEKLTEGSDGEEIG